MPGPARLGHTGGRCPATAAGTDPGTATTAPGPRLRCRLLNVHQQATVRPEEARRVRERAPAVWAAVTADWDLLAPLAVVGVALVVPVQVQPPPAQRAVAHLPPPNRPDQLSILVDPARNSCYVDHASTPLRREGVRRGREGTLAGLAQWGCLLRVHARLTPPLLLPGRFTCIRLQFLPSVSQSETRRSFRGQTVRAATTVRPTHSSPSSKVCDYAAPDGVTPTTRPATSGDLVPRED